jgi:hypothetical protein
MFEEADVKIEWLDARLNMEGWLDGRPINV